VDNKTLTIVLCQTREGNFNYSSLLENVLGPLKSDLAFCGNAEPNSEDKILNESRYIWNFPEPSDWATACDEISSEESNWRELCIFGDNFLGGTGYGNTVGSGLIIMYWREILRQNLTSEILNKYEWFVITRSDFKWIARHPSVELLNEDEIYFLDGEKYGGISDRHIIFNRSHADKILGIASPIFKDSSQLVEDLTRKGIYDLNPEKYLLTMLEKIGLESRLRFLPYMGFSIRHPGANTRWSQGKYDKRLGLYIKYPTEFRYSNYAKFAIRSNKDWNYILNSRMYLRYLIYRLLLNTDRLFNVIRYRSQRKYFDSKF
jgi:hypothetical protein